MAKWQRFGDGTWVNVDHVEVVRVEEDDEGGWQLTAAFASGSTHALGRAADRELLVDCTDVLLRDEVGEHLRALTDTPAAPATPATPAAPDLIDLRDEPAAIVLDYLSNSTGNSTQLSGVSGAVAQTARRRWRFWRAVSHDGVAPDPADAEGQPEGVQLQPVG